MKMRFFSSGSGNGGQNLSGLGAGGQQMLLNGSQGLGQIGSLGLSSPAAYSQLAAQGLVNGVNGQQLLSHQLPQFSSNQQFLTNGVGGINTLNANQLSQLNGQFNGQLQNQLQGQLLGQLQNQMGNQLGGQIGLQGIPGLNTGNQGVQQLGLNQFGQLGQLGQVNQAQVGQLQGLNQVQLNQLGLNGQVGQLGGLNLAQLNGLNNPQLAQFAQPQGNMGQNQRGFF